MEYMFLLSVPIFIVLYVLTQTVLHKLQNFPPAPLLSLPILGHLYLLKGPLQPTLSKLADKYGPLYFLRLGTRPVIVISSASIAEECFTKKNDVILANRPNLLIGEYLGYNNTSIVWANYGDHWRNHRRISSLEILSSYRVQKLAHIRVDEVNTLIRHCYRASVEKNGEPLVIRPLLFDLVSNVLTRMIAGKRFYGEDTESVEGKRFQDMVRETGKLLGGGTLGNFSPILTWFMFSGLVKKLMVVQKERDALVQEWIDEIRETKSNDSKGKEKSMIEILVSLQETEPEYHSDEDIKSLMLELLQAGVSTSTDTMEWAMTRLVNSPEILKKAQDEIDTRLGQAHLLTETDVLELPYLRCIINETLRLHPVAPFAVPHESSEECTIAGFRIPRGTMLLPDLKAIQTDLNVWADPLVFRPERFEGEDKVGFKWIPFGAGRRGCPGEGLANRMVGLAVGSLLQCFDWARAGEDMVDVTERSGLTAPKAEMLKVLCWPRPSMVNLLAQI